MCPALQLLRRDAHPQWHMEHSCISVLELLVEGWIQKKRQSKGRGNIANTHQLGSPSWLSACCECVWCDDVSVVPLSRGIQRQDKHVVPIDSHWGREERSGEKAQKKNKGLSGKKCNSEKEDERDTEERNVRIENIDERQRFTLAWLSISYSDQWDRAHVVSYMLTVLWSLIRCIHYLNSPVNSCPRPVLQRG